MDRRHNKTDKNHNNASKKIGRPRLENNPLREYWREAKKKQKANQA